jgi:5-oxoprolinase (ATP-hydrolysing) subunit C
MLLIERLGFASVQDAGRPGLTDLGVSSGGFADAYHAQLANALLTNELNCPAVEVYAGAFRVRATSVTVIALAGADVRVRIKSQGQEQLSAGNRALCLQVGDELEIVQFVRGNVMYLALPGGVIAPCVLGSASYDSALGLRSLRQGFELSAAQPNKLAMTRLHIPAFHPAEQALRYIPSVPDAPSFAEFTVDVRSHRHALILQETLATVTPSVVSRGVVPGTIQLPPNGKPIILGVDAQTVGGYPEVGCVVRADLWRLAQFRAGERLSLQAVTMEQAQALWLSHVNNFARQCVAIACSSSEAVAPNKPATKESAASG